MNYKCRWILFLTVVLVLGAEWFNHPFLWMLSIFGVLFFTEMRAQDLQDTIETKEKVMGKRLIDGMKVLGDLMKNAFDHIKTNTSKIDKMTRGTVEMSSKIHRLEQRRHQETSQKQILPPSLVVERTKSKKEDKEAKPNE